MRRTLTSPVARLAQRTYVARSGHTVLSNKRRPKGVMLSMGNGIGKVVASRYNRTISDAVEDLPITKKVEVYKELQQQMQILSELQSELTASIIELDTEEAQLQNQEDLIERQRRRYLRKINTPGPITAENDDDYDSSDSEEEQEDGEQEVVITAQSSEEAPEDDPPSEHDLGCIKVHGNADQAEDSTRIKLRKVLEEELPEIQRAVAVKLRTLEWKRDDLDDKLTDTRKQMLDLQRLMDEISPGIPALSNSV